MAWIDPKLNWLEGDYINFVDWNRIENNILELRNYLASIQYSPPVLTTITNRDYKSIDFLSSINRIEANLDNLRVAFFSPADYLPKETWIVGKTFDYADANRLEGNTSRLLTLGMSVYQSYRYCGTVTCGEWGGLE
jgi:hypothetical protein